MKIVEVLKKYIQTHFGKNHNVTEWPRLHVEIFEDVTTNECKIYISNDEGYSGNTYKINTTADAGEALTHYLEEQL